MITGSCHENRHDDCTLRYGCACDCHTDAVAAERATLADTAPIRGAALPPEESAHVDHLPAARVIDVDQFEVYDRNGPKDCSKCGKACASPRALGQHRRHCTGPTPAAPIEDGAVFSHGSATATTPRSTEDAPMPKAPLRDFPHASQDECPECGHVAASSQGLAVHRARKHGVKGTSRNPGAKRPPTPKPPVPPVVEQTPPAGPLSEHTVTFPVHNADGGWIGTVTICVAANVFDLSPELRAGLFQAVDSFRTAVA